jgi:RNA polymerase sigma-70 factor, ECF subfamily
MNSAHDTPFRVVEIAARESYGRLIAMLVSRTSNLAAAEDALSHAFVSALETWPRDGVPDNPDAWLFQVASNMVRDRLRRSKAEEVAFRELANTLNKVQASVDSGIQDERLAMLFLCAHPAIDDSVRTPLMLQAVLGLDAARLASAFLLSPTTLGQRLVRAKKKIREARIAMTMPEPEHQAQRLDDVLACIYAAYTLASDGFGRDPRMAELSRHAIDLGELVAELLPDQPEALGLLALMYLCESRRSARLDALGRFVPLAAQDTSLWNRSLIARGEQKLWAASRLQCPGRFQFEAAIQSAHCSRSATGSLRWHVIRDLYLRLIEYAPSVGAQCGYAASTYESGDPVRALNILEAIDPRVVTTYQPYWATRAPVLARHGRFSEASKAYEMAIGLTEDPAIRVWLLDQNRALGHDPTP